MSDTAIVYACCSISFSWCTISKYGPTFWNSDMIWIYFEEALLWWFAETHTNPFNGPLSVTTQVSRYQKGNTNLDFAEARDSEWQWHQLGHVHCKSAPRSRQITTPAPHHSVFTGRMPFLLPSQQHQSTEFDFLWNKQRGGKLLILSVFLWLKM